MPINKQRILQLARALQAAPEFTQSKGLAPFQHACSARAQLRSGSVRLPPQGRKHIALQQSPFRTFASHAGDPEEAEAVLREVAAAFDRLITTAYELVQNGKPQEAEYVLQEGAKQAEEVLGSGSMEVAPLFDQLALLRFMHDRCVEAVDPAHRAMEILAEFCRQDESVVAGGAAAAAAVRLASTLIGAGETPQAVPLLKSAASDLEAAVGTLRQLAAQGGEGHEEVEEALGKFETAQGECTYYLALSQLATAQGLTAEGVEAATGPLEAGLRQLQEHLGPRHPLTACALREHNKLTEGAVASEHGDLAEALYRQEVRLHQTFDPDSEHVAALLYELGTHQYCRGRYNEAVHTLERCMTMVRSGFEGGEDHLLTAKHRLGMALGAAGQHERAQEMLHGIAPDLVDRLGPDNPVSSELNFMAALVELRQAAAAGGGAVDAALRRSLLDTMQVNLQALQEVGEEHLLVKHATAQFEAAQQIGGGGG